MSLWPQVSQRLSAQTTCVLITVEGVKGSAPRDVGTQMLLVKNAHQWGTIGGGALEWQATKLALELLETPDQHRRVEKDFILGPDLDQCCGGHVVLSFEVLTPEQLQMAQQRAVDEKTENLKQHLMLFGAGHIGKALVHALAPLEFSINWFDSRENIFPKGDLSNVNFHSLENPAQCFELATQNSFALIMTHDHQLDFDVTLAALKSPEVWFVGLIGSATKRARFCKRFDQHGLSSDQLSKLTCPIGLSGISDKSPPAIAASVVAQLLQQTQMLKINKKSVHLTQNRA